MHGMHSSHGTHGMHGMQVPAEQQLLKYIEAENVGLPLELEDDERPLSYFGLLNNGKVLVYDGNYTWKGKDKAELDDGGD